jgi:UDP-N-acetylmuramoylalanine--D-glutamate ligase
MRSLTLVVGLGKTGLSIARHLKRQQIAFVVFDTRDKPEGLDEFKAEFPDVSVFLSTLPESIFLQIETMISSPGVSLDIELFQKARQLGLPILGDIECFARVVSAPVVAITGTNGKSTVTSLVGEMAKAAGLKVAVAGNIGTPVLDRLGEGVEYDLWVLELSSFQLDLTENLVANAATVINVTPDHLDRHHTMAAYWAAKQRIYQGAAVCLFNRDDEQTRPDSAYVDTESQGFRSYGLSEPEADDWGLRQDETGAYYIARGMTLVLPVDALRLKGRHNWLNAMAACALAECVNIPMSTMKEVLTEFSGLPHRCQWVRALHEVVWINDSKGTNVGATLSAISGIGGSMQGKIVLIAGGQGKGADFTLLQDAMTTYVRSVILIGEDADKLEQALQGHVPMLHAETLDAAVGLAKTQAHAGDVVLLSPACASLDMFRDFNHRGEVFTAAVASL